MALTTFQARILRLLAAQRKAGAESYVAGGVALNVLIAAPRRSRDIDLFRGGEAELARALDRGEIGFHAGRIGGSWPRFVELA
jgi:hypothetical protein